MTVFREVMAKLARDEAGATAIEYGLIAALVSVAAITAMGGLGNTLSNTFSKRANRHLEPTRQAGLTKLSSTRLRPALSKSISSLLPSCSATAP